ncbi:hypothetical protein ACFU6I_16125 [Streptomyces sp. NPDC057486]|uniref:hypothetical protein n=1 Tax=Streptomyces sp. NPDC057486 TaxID=3346145 RepID=UPI0036CBE6E3
MGELRGLVVGESVASAFLEANIPGAEHITYIGRSDEGDKVTVRIGIGLWNKCGADLTQGQFHSELLKIFDGLQGTDKIYMTAMPTGRRSACARWNNLLASLGAIGST